MLSPTGFSGLKRKIARSEIGVLINSFATIVFHASDKMTRFFNRSWSFNANFPEIIRRFFIFHHQLLYFFAQSSCGAQAYELGGSWRRWWQPMIVTSSPSHSAYCDVIIIPIIRFLRHLSIIQPFIPSAI